MLNNFMLVGRLTEDPKIFENEESKIATINLGVQRQYKNVYGEYETDFINCIILFGIAERVIEYCTKGDIVGVKGRIQIKDGKIELLAEKVTFLSNKKN